MRNGEDDMAIPKKPKVVTDIVTPEGTQYKCTKCGATYEKPVNRFFKTKSKLYQYNDMYYPVCTSCLKEKFEEYKKRYNEHVALIIICHYLDIPFYYSLYDSIIKKNDGFSIGMYVRQMNQKQYETQTFVNSLVDKKELGLDSVQYEEVKESKWTLSEMRNKKNTIEIVGYDPFEGYLENQRRFLFNDVIGYLGEEGIEDDNYKISQIVQLVKNNYQIYQIDLGMARLDPIRDGVDYKNLSGLKKQLVDSNDKIAKENGISVKNRLNMQAGGGTLTGLMKRLRELDIPNAEANYYDQLRGDGTQWAATMSFKAIKENGFFDENDFKDMMESQYKLIQDLQKRLDDVEEENRLLLIENDELKAGGR